MKLIPERVTRLRTELNMTQRDLADAVGTSQTQVSRYELGDNQPTAPALFAMAMALNTSADYLCGLTDDPDARMPSVPNMQVARDIGSRIKHRRTQLHLRQMDLAELTGISQSQISRHEMGDANPTADSLVAIARVLDVSTDYLVGLTPQAYAINPGDLTTDERLLLDAYRRKDLIGSLELLLQYAKQ